MRNSNNLSTYQAEYDTLVRKLRYRHPSYFDEYKSYQTDMFPDDSRTENDLRRDYYKMAFKIEIRQNPKFSNLSYEDIDEVYSNLSHFEEKNN
jgi:hypothetical protein